MFVFDVETLGVESTTVILSAAIVHFDATKNPSYQDLLDGALFVKFNSKDQVKRLGRSVDLGTLEWWQNQHEYVRRVSLDPSGDDVLAEDGIRMLHDYMNKFPNANKMTMWTRGSLDQMSIDSLCKKVDMQLLTGYNMYRDVRTAIDCFTGSTNGYCNVDYPGFERASVIKHHPVHDCALDAMMLMYGK
jgi:hypothetical protein